MDMYKLIIKGIVQGVGFRPYIYRKAVGFGLVGYVKNIGSGVEVVVNDKDFIVKLNDIPPLAKINEYSIEKISESKDNGYSKFLILKSDESLGETIIPPDIFLCEDCLIDLRDKNDRRYDYYFITCTNCGPRFTMIKNYPYDRKYTSMEEFKMCPECHTEYTNPMNRRYHAETIACKNCGPKLKLLSKQIKQSDDSHIFDIKELTHNSDRETIKKASELILSGEPISIKGVGGFHICSLSDETSANKVKKLLGRFDKPFALMVKDINTAENIVTISEKEGEMLKSPQRPIVVLKKKDNNKFKSISELDSLGIMLPYTGLHYLLFDFIDEPLLMTSCNIPGEPIHTKEILGKYFLTHERKIVNPCDDSVVKFIDDKLFYLRRSRGFVPLPINLPINCKDTLALGAELNNVICIAKKKQCFLSQYIGETSKLGTLEYMKSVAERLIKITRATPKIIACDLHPTYNSTQLAAELSEKYSAELIKIQHHKAHVASVAAEQEITDYIGIAVDGLGYGDDGKIWGGEIFDVTNGTQFKRIGSLEEQPQIGGDSATIHPKKMLYGILSKNKNIDEKEIKKLNLYTDKEIKMYNQMSDNKFNINYTTSTGRILDSTAALLGICDHRTYDGRLAMLLESKATMPLDIELKFEQKEDRIILSTSHLFRFLLDQMNRKNKNEIEMSSNKNGIGRLAATTQMYIAKGLFEIAKNAANKKNKPILLSGGVTYNRMIATFMMKQGVFVNKEIPCGDGGICYGQTYLSNIL